MSAFLVVISDCGLGANAGLTVHARERGAETWWKSFTTGKSASKLGGIPHDTYGMTSRSIRQYIVGIYKQLGLREKDVTKVQTGGPGKRSLGMSVLLDADPKFFFSDGDLGSSALSLCIM